MLNKVFLIGRLGKDPDLRYTQSGVPVASFSLATDDVYNDRDGNRVTKTEWHNIVVFDKAAQNCSNYLGKGSLVFIEGSIQTRKYQDKQGQDRYITEIKAQKVQFLDRRGENRGQQGADGYAPPSQGVRRPPQQGGGFQDTQEDMGSPFPSEAMQDTVPF